MELRKKILIVEDDSFARVMMRQIIQSLDGGLEIDLAQDGIDGCEQVENDPEAYGLILMDIHMPRLSGLEATKRIRKHTDNPPNEIPIFAVTADSDMHHPLAMKKYQMDGFIAKPISSGDLVGLVEKYCNGAQNILRSGLR